MTEPPIRYGRSWRKTPEPSPDDAAGRIGAAGESCLAFGRESVGVCESVGEPLVGVAAPVLGEATLRLLLSRIRIPPRRSVGSFPRNHCADQCLCAYLPAPVRVSTGTTAGPASFTGLFVLSDALVAGKTHRARQWRGSCLGVFPRTSHRTPRPHGKAPAE